MKLKMGVTYRQVKESKSDTIYYSSRTPWWTDDPDDIQHAEPRKEFPDYQLPVDILGAPLFQAPKMDFLKHVEAKPQHYGEFGIEGFMAMHHKNFELDDENDKHRLIYQRDLFKTAIANVKLMSPSFSLL